MTVLQGAMDAEPPYSAILVSGTLPQCIICCMFLNLQIAAQTVVWYEAGSGPHVFVQLYSYQLGRACTHIYVLGICHHDIKPQNLLVDGHTHMLKL